jgi:hypothetical protein
MSENIIRVRPEGTERTVIKSNIRTKQLNVVGGWIYYIDVSGRYADDGGHIVKIRTDGTGETTLVSDRTAHTMSVVGDWIYYTTKSGQLYRIKTDGTQKTALINNSNIYVGMPVVSNGYVYFVNFSTPNNGIERIRTDGTGGISPVLNLETATTEISTDMSCFDVVGDWIYFYGILYDVVIKDSAWGALRTYSNGQAGFYRVRIDGSDLTRIATLGENEYNPSFIISDGWIYYRTSNSEEEINYMGNLYRMRLDGTENTRLRSTVNELKAVLGDHVIYNTIASDKNLQTVIIKNDGSSPRVWSS